MLLFGASTYRSLLGGLLVAVAAAVLHGVAYGLFRGQQDMRRANLLQFTAVGALPVGVLLWDGLSVAESAYWIGTAWLVIAAVGVVVGLRRSSGGSSCEDLRHAVGELLRYGIPRIPGEFALSGIFAIPVVVLAQRGGVEAAGHLGFGITLVSLAASGFAPLGLFVLPSIATRFGAGDVSGVRRDVVRLLCLCLFLVVTGVAVIQGGVPFLVTVGLGAEFEAAVPVVRLALLAAIPYVCYVVLRAVLDAASAWPYNSKNLLISLASFVVIVTLLPGATVVVFAMLLSVALLGVLSIVDAWRVLPRAPRSSRD